MPTMLNIREIRLRAGMTQEQLAVYLGVSRATLSLAELHQRRLPNRAVPALQRLCDLHTQHTTNSGAESPEALIAAIAALNKLRTSHNRQAMLLRVQLKRMKKRYERLVVFVHCLRDCEQRDPQMAPMPVGKNVQRQLQRCDMLAQLHLEFRAASFEAQANIAAHMMEALEFRLQRLQNR